MMFATFSLMAVLALSGATAQDMTLNRFGAMKSVGYDFGSDVPCGEKGAGDDRLKIFGGTAALPGEFPWQVKVQSGSFQCGGSIISENVVVTAAHCLFTVKERNRIPDDDIHITAGIVNLDQWQGAQERNVKKSVVHHVYDKMNNESSADIALLFLEDPLTLERGKVAIICLPESGEKFSGEAITAGWGMTSAEDASNILLKVSVPLKPRCDPYCKLCAGGEPGRDACVGDSGGPLMCEEGGRYYLCGIVSYGTTLTCGEPGVPGVYTETSCYVDWIREQVRSLQ